MIVYSKNPAPTPPLTPRERIEAALNEIEADRNRLREYVRENEKMLRHEGGVRFRYVRRYLRVRRRERFAWFVVAVLVSVVVALLAGGAR